MHKKFFYIFILATSFLLFKNVSSLFTDEDINVFSCQDGWVGELPKDYKEFMTECFKDKAISIECRKHCLAKKMSLFLDNKIWLYQLIIVLKRLYPGRKGEESVDKMIDVILQCTDEHSKDFGPFIPYLCYREKIMWSCILKSANQICANNRKHRQEQQELESAHKNSG